MPHDWTDRTALELARDLLDSYQHWLNEELLERGPTLEAEAQRLWEAPFVVVAHGTEADPILQYGNRIALGLWEMDWPTLTSTPSRFTAEPMHRDERARLLERTTRDGYIADYTGIRISKTGRRFRLGPTMVWNLRDATGRPLGQAATFRTWEYL